MSTADSIREFARPVELLAPAGRWDALEAVMQAGADAVYVGLKNFNMRMHRSDFHFTEEQLVDAVGLAHGLGKRLYITLNALLAESELDDMRQLLMRLAWHGVDAVIVQDLAAIRMVREMGLDVPLHASTMMNVHHPEQARALKELGVTRIITSRDIDIRTAGELGRLADVEVEYFVHGDMCVAQSGQCSMSGVLFGKSANRGQCMKPCRWEYDLVALEDGQTHGHIAQGHLLAIKDLCLLRHVPDLIQAGICALKIEGRMRDAAYLRELVASYRQVIDHYYACPPAFAVNVAAVENTLRRQVRELSTLIAIGGSSHTGMFDISGRREPLFLSDGYVEPLGEEELPESETASAGAEFPTHTVELAVCVADLDAAKAAICAGADRLYLAAEVSQRNAVPWLVDTIVAALEDAHRTGVRVGLRTPRITTQREWGETRWLVSRLAGHSLDFVLAHNLATLRLAREFCSDASIIADYGFNLLNSAAAETLVGLGVAQATFSSEAGLVDLAALAAATPLPLEILAHGPITGMLVDHCVIALNASPAGRKDVCRGPCRHATFGLRDRTGEVRPIIADQHCRNHLLTARDLAIFPRLEAFLFPTVSSIRIEGQFYSSDWVEEITKAYRVRLDAVSSGRPSRESLEGLWDRLCSLSTRGMNLGPYARSIVRARSTAKVMQELRR